LLNPDLIACPYPARLSVPDTGASPVIVGVAIPWPAALGRLMSMLDIRECPVAAILAEHVVLRAFELSRTLPGVLRGSSVAAAVENS
jgi:hypothetical protein